MGAVIYLQSIPIYLFDLYGNDNPTSDVIFTNRFYFATGIKGNPRYKRITKRTAPLEFIEIIWWYLHPHVNLCTVQFSL